MHTPVWVKNNGSLKEGDDKYLVPKKEWINFLNFEDLFNTKLLTHKECKNWHWNCQASASKCEIRFVWNDI